jgi:predicted membrane-bound dolichyl-phosphate-mannose-protein mannosyltransferase
MAMNLQTISLLPTMNALWAIIGPALAAIEAFQMLDVLMQFFRRVFPIIHLQSQISKDPKPEPVRVRHPASKDEHLD